MVKSDFERRNFLFFLNEVNPMNVGGSLISGLVNPSSWQITAETIATARASDAFVRTINKAQIYIHVPFCERICSFCHCSRQLLRRRSDIDEYVKILIKQMDLLAPVCKNMDFETLIFGGGTPSVLDEDQIETILDSVDKAFPCQSRSIQYEINPSSWTESKLSVLCKRGLYRLSIGVQSFDAKVLKSVSRDQTKEQVLWCIRSARKAGVPFLNVDLMAGLPGQTGEGLLEDLRVVINEGANVVHVEPYGAASLTELCSPGEKPLDYHNKRDLMMRSSIEILLKEGFRRKGLQGTFTRDGIGEEHNQEAYINLEAAVLGFGPYARGQFPGALFYRTEESKPSSCLPGIEVAFQDFKNVMSQYVVFSIFDGLKEGVFLKRFGIPLVRHFGEGLRYLQDSGLIECSQGIWKISGKPDLKRTWEYMALSRGLLGEEILSNLRTRFQGRYDPRMDYSKGASLIKAYGDNTLMTLYYNMGV